MTETRYSTGIQQVYDRKKKLRLSGNTQGSTTFKLVIALILEPKLRYSFFFR